MQGMDFERILGGVCAPEGFLASAVSCGIKEKGELDLALLYSETPAVAVGAFTRNELKAAPVIYSQKCIESKTARAVVVNSGNANSMTGSRGLGDAEAMAATVEKALDLSSGTVLVASTGPIGEYLPMEKVTRGIEQAVAELSPGGNTDAAKGIMTTDTYPKELAVEMEIAGKVVRMGAMAKGSGMIHPDLATLLCFLTTDADISGDFLREALREAADVSFNMVSIDGDTSTNDTLLILANGLAGGGTINKDSPPAAVFQATLKRACIHRARAIARDGEGATRLIEVKVTGAASLADARLAARTIVSSPLVKSAVHGCDPNWGRVLAAAGRSGAELVPDRLELHIGGIRLVEGGSPVPFRREEVAKHLGGSEVYINLNLHIGQAEAVAWGCDLSEEYVTINSEYTT